MGTPMYMSPEAIRSPQDIDGRSDLYAVGAVGYYLLTGQPLFEGDTFMEICGHHLHTQPTPPSERLKKSVPKDLEALILACLEKDPARRPANARVLARRLETCQDANGWRTEDIAYIVRIVRPIHSELEFHG